MVEIPALSALIKEPGLCARSSHAAPEHMSNTSLRKGMADEQQGTATASTRYTFSP